MTYPQVLAFFKNKARIARFLGYSRQNIQRWEEENAVPLHAQRLLEKKTKGKLKARPLEPGEVMRRPPK
jgi:hypothetical protein